jgi:hypothetical protein
MPGELRHPAMRMTLRRRSSSSSGTSVPTVRSFSQHRTNDYARTDPVQGFLAGERDVEAGARAIVLLRPDAPAMAFTIVLHTDRPKAHALLLGGDEGLEDLLQAAGGQARAMSQTENSTSSSPSERLMIVSLRSPASPAMAVAGVDHQVEQHLLQLHPVPDGLPAGRARATAAGSRRGLIRSLRYSCITR